LFLNVCKIYNYLFGFSTSCIFDNFYTIKSKPSERPTNNEYR